MMRIFKNFIIMIIIFRLTVPVFALSDMAEDSNAPYSEALNVLRGLYFFQVADEELFDPEENITKAEFLSMMERLILGGQYSMQVENSDVFSDVTETTPHKNAIMLAHKAGLISGDGEGKFYPGKDITLNEAATILVNLLGYDVNAHLKGGYPTGYLLVAREINLINKSISLRDNALNWGQAAQLIYNSFDIKIQTGLSVGDNILYSKDKSLIETKMGYIHSVGILKAIEAKSVSSSYNVNRYEVQIDNEIYDIGFAKLKDILGRKVHFFYKEKDDDSKELIYIDKHKSNVEVVLEKDEIIECNDRVITYTSSDSKYQSNINISVNADIVYNGRPVSGMYDDLVNNMTGGRVVLINTGTQNEYDIVLIEDEATYSVQTVKTLEETIIPMFGIADLRFQSENSSTQIRIINESGIVFYSVRDAGLGKWDIITITESLDSSVIDIRVSTRKIEGVIEEVFEDGGYAKAVIDKKEYIFHTRIGVDDLQIGYKGIFCLDVHGRIYAIDTGAASNVMTYGLVIAAAVNDSMLSEMHIKMLSENNKITVFTLQKDTIVDGVKVANIAEKFRIHIRNINNNQSVPSVCPGLWDSNVRIKRQIVRYMLNESGKIINIDTPYYNAAHEKNYNTTFSIIEAYNSSADADGNHVLSPASDKSLTYFRSAAKFIGTASMDIYLAGKTKVFYAPRDSDFNEEIHYSVRDREHLQNYSYYINAYKSSADSVHADVIVMYRSADRGYYSPGTGITLIESVKMGYENDQFVYKFTGYTGNRRVTETCIDDKLLDSVPVFGKRNVTEPVYHTERLQPGDIIRYEKNGAGYVDTVEIIYAFNSDTMLSSNPLGQTGDRYSYYRSDTFRIHRQYVYSINDRFVTFTREHPSTVSVSENGLVSNSEIHIVDSATVLIYSDTNNRVNISIGAVSDLKDYIKHGGNCSRVFLYTANLLPKTVIIYE